MTLDVSIVIPTYNRSKLLPKLLDSLEKMLIPEGLSYEIILVDNNSRDNTKEIVERFIRDGIRNFRYVFEQDQGSSCSRNRGIREAEGEIIAFTDDDQLVDPMWISSLWKTFQEYDADCVGGRITYLVPESAPGWLKELLAYDRPRGIGQLNLGPEAFIAKQISDLPKGGNMAFRKDCLVACGAFDIRLGKKGNTLLGSGEETKLVNKVFESDYRVIYQPNAIVYHLLNTQRLSKAYWRKSFFDMGRTRAIMLNPHGNPIALRHLLRSVRGLVPALLRWICLTAFLQFGRALKNELAFRGQLGMVYQSLRARNRSAGTL